MTLFIVTVTDDFALVSQDTAAFSLDESNVARSEDFATINADDVQKLATLESRSTQPTDKPKYFTSKIVMLPHLHMVLGGAGYHELILGWSQVMTVTAGRDLVELDPVVADGIKRVAKIIKTEQPAMIYHVGLDKSADRMTGYLYNAAESYQSTRLEAGHAMMPLPSPDHEDYDELARCWTAAAHGEGAEEFHVRMAKNQYDSFWRGRYKHGSGIGGQLHTARIDRDGIRVWVSHEFPGYADQVAALGKIGGMAAALARAASVG